MSRPAIVTDSSAQLTGELTAGLDVRVVPIEILIDGETDPETDLDVDLFYERILHGARASTSLPSPGRLAAVYRAAAAGGATEVLSIHLDGRASGTVAGAQLAALEVPVDVTVVDTRTASFGVGICVLAAARAARDGRSGGEIRELVAQLAASLDNVFVASDAPGGRVPSGSGLPLLTFVDGATTAVAACDNFECAAVAMAARVPAGRPMRAAVGHAHELMAARADELATLLENTPYVRDVLRYRVSPSVGAHTGPWSFGAFWWPD